MSDNKIEIHLTKALVSNNRNEDVHQKKFITLPSAMTSVHKTLVSLFLFIVIIIAISSQAQIDIVVSARGELLLDTDVEKIPHLEGGILEELYVKKGDNVYQGEPIARLRAVERTSQFASTTTEIVQQQLNKIRYQNLIDMTKPDFSKYQNEYADLVASNLEAWQQEYSKNISNQQLITHDIDHKKSLISSMRNRVLSSKRQLSIIREQLKIKKTLYKEGMVSYVDVLNMQVQESNMVREIENLNESIMNENFQLAKFDKQLHDLIENRNAEYQTQLIQAQNELEIKQLSIATHSDKVERLTVYAPIDGVIDKVHFNFHSAVIPPGESIADIVAISNKLHGEAKVMRKDMGFVEHGQEVKIKLDTYNFAKYGSIQGKITSISRSSYQEEETEFYLATIEIDRNYLERNGIQYKLAPYMEFTADIKTGSRRVIEYAAKPVMSALESAFDEQ